MRSTPSASPGVVEEPRRRAGVAAPPGEPPCGETDLAGARAELPLPNTIVINLDRRPDRLARFQEQAGQQKLKSYRRFPAIDGTRLALTDEIRHLFRGNDFNYRRGIIGCALSHLELWQSVRQTTLVCEDDVAFADSFLSKLRSTIQQAERIDPEWDLIVLGWSPWSALHGEPPRESASPRLIPMEWSEFMGGGFAYCISPNGAAKLVRRATERGAERHRLVCHEAGGPLEGLSTRTPDCILVLCARRREGGLGHPIRSDLAGSG
jgi:hypothetical protein